MSSPQPWLDSLSDDWPSSPGTPTTPQVHARSVASPLPLSRRSSLRDSPSRIPVPARRSVEPSSPVVDTPQRRVARPCHFVKKEPPKKVQRAPMKPRTPKAPAKCDLHTHGIGKPKQHSPAPKQSPKPKPSPKSSPKSSPKPIPKSNPAGAARSQVPPIDTRSPLRSVSNTSTQSQSNLPDSSTVQIKPKKGSQKNTTPEWRRRLIRGETPGEQRDLFGPIGLESVFKPPSPGSEAGQQHGIPVLKQTEPPWTTPDNDAEQAHDKRSSTPATKINDPPDDTEPSHERQHSPYVENGSGSVAGGGDGGYGVESPPPESPGKALDIRKGERKASRDKSENHDNNTSQHNITLPRSASGLEDLRNEGITPIYVSLGSESRPDSRASDSALLHPQAGPSQDMLDVTSNSLPRDLSMGTMDFGRRRPFVNSRRRQYLSDWFFQEHQQLTPSSFPSQRFSPSALANSRIRSSPPFYDGLQHPEGRPMLPRPSPSHARVSSSGSPESKSTTMQQPSGSPLKLFGDHDTFTNNKLLRRMSQFEESLSDEDEPVSPSEEVRRKGQNRGLLSVRQGPLGNPSMRRNERSRTRNATSPRMSLFGDGELDDYDFSDTSPYEPKMLNCEHEDQPHSHLQSSGQRFSAGHNFHWHNNTTSRDYVRHSQTSGSSSSRKRRSKLRKSIHNGTRGNPFPVIEECHDYPDYRDSPDGKRMSNSPTKNPNPKRRRTLPLSDESPDQDRRSIEDVSLLSDGDVSLLRRNLMYHGLKDDEEGIPFSRPQSACRTGAPISNQTKTSAGNGHSSTRKRSSDSNEVDEVGSSPRGIDVPKVKVTGANDEFRKGSITTQDFLDEATKIMDRIRANGSTTGRLPSVEESDMESENDVESDEESTQEGFSRPPSREGVDIRNLRVPREPNPRVLSHLMKFQEDDDLEFAVSASVTSLHLDRNRDPEASLDGTVRTRDEQPQSHEAAADGGDATIDSQTSARQSTVRSIPTGSSQSSQAKGVLPSDLASRLIPEQVNGLTYDRFKHQWVKGAIQHSTGRPQGEDSDDDPFRDIPDLSVDELEEMMDFQTLNSSIKLRDSTPAKKPDGINGQTDSRVSEGEPELQSRPQTGQGEPSANGSTLHSKLTRFTSSVPNTGGTRATSWSTDDMDFKERSQDVEHEIQLHEGRLSQPPNHANGPAQQPRVVTISFSSPVVSHVAYGENHSPMNQRGRLDFYHGTPKRRVSLGERSLVRRPVSRIDEKNEDATVDDGQSLVQRCNNGPTIGATKNENSFLQLPDAGQGTSYAFELSTLSDFTVDQIDHPHHPEASYVDRRTHPTSLRQVHGRFALATQDLVKHITDAEPQELYWEDLRRLILREKGLNGLYKLSDFCPRLEDLDVSDNDIEHLNGVPRSLRTLKIQRNLLSSQTAWGHLINLQYLDISGNELENLHGFHELIHLRELKANNNRIRNIDGVLDLNGLLSLKLSNNSLSEVHFEDSELTRLRELDLSRNQLKLVTSVDSLPSLSTLNLSFNEINRLDVSMPLYNLHSLKLSGNRFDALNISMFPSLALLYLDQNFLSAVSGLERCHRLEVLSVREQLSRVSHGPAVSSYLDFDLGLARDIRKVFLSSNRLSPRVLSPSASLLSLQLLDIAACSIQKLPADFAVNFANIKVLNMNFNSLAGVEELVGMKSLSRLAVVGNRITRMRRLCQVLSRMGKTTKKDMCTLREVDLRGNPLTIGFYPPPLTGRGRNVEEKRLKTRATEDRPRRKGVGVDFPTIMANLGRCPDDMVHMKHPAAWEDDDDEYDDHDDHHDDKIRIEQPDTEIDDPYTVPRADAQADRKYLPHLDDSTKLRRRVLELMLYAGSGGSIKSLDGLKLHPDLDQGEPDMKRAWAKLEELGVMRKRSRHITE